MLDMTVGASSDRNRLTFAVSQPSEALRQGQQAVDQLITLAPLLTAGEKRILLGRLTDAFGGAAVGTGSIQPTAVKKPPAQRAPAQAISPATARRPQQSMGACPHCGVVLRVDRLQEHIRKWHATRAGEGTGQQQGSGEQILCGDCERMMNRDQYDTHDCVPNRRSVYTVGGGAPGLGRRR